jgi:hypothetical protein
LGRLKPQNFFFALKKYYSGGTEITAKVEITLKYTVLLDYVPRISNNIPGFINNKHDYT